MGWIEWMDGPDDRRKRSYQHMHVYEEKEEREERELEMVGRSLFLSSSSSSGLAAAVFGAPSIRREYGNHSCMTLYLAA